MVLLHHIRSVINEEVAPLNRIHVLFDELLACAALLPFLAIDYRLRLDETATCSDASEQGGGVCASTGLTEMGMARLGEAVRGVGRGRVIPVGLCETFAGIAGARRAFDILGCTPAFHISLETSEEAIRVSRCQYPGALHLGDVKDATRETMAEALRDAPDVDLVFHTSAPPCQDVTGLSAQRTGFSGERSRLADYIPSINDMLQSSFPRPRSVHYARWWRRLVRLIRGSMTS